MKNLNPRKKGQSANTEEKMFKQAVRLFLAKGYHGTSIDDITQAAGLTKGSLYWHFAGKEDLLRRIIGEYENIFLDGMIRVVGEMQGGSPEKFEKLCRYSATFAYYNPELCVCFTRLAAELCGDRRKIETQIKRVYKKFQRFLTNLILQGKKEKTFRKEIDTNLTALEIIAFHEGTLLQWFMNRYKVNGERLAETFKKIVLDGLMTVESKK